MLNIVGRLTPLRSPSIPRRCPPPLLATSSALGSSPSRPPPGISPFLSQLCRRWRRPPPFARTRSTCSGTLLASRGRKPRKTAAGGIRGPTSRPRSHLELRLATQRPADAEPETVETSLIDCER